jgi:hypothetical protein
MRSAITSALTREHCTTDPFSGQLSCRSARAVACSCATVIKTITLLLRMVSRNSSGYARGPCPDRRGLLWQSRDHQFEDDCLGAPRQTASVSTDDREIDQTGPLERLALGDQRSYAEDAVLHLGPVARQPLAAGFFLASPRHGHCAQDEVVGRLVVMSGALGVVTEVLKKDFFSKFPEPGLELPRHIFGEPGVDLPA